MTTSESKGLRITNRIESIRIANWNALMHRLLNTVFFFVSRVLLNLILIRNGLHCERQNGHRALKKIHLISFDLKTNLTFSDSTDSSRAVPELHASRIATKTGFCRFGGEGMDFRAYCLC